MNLTKPPVPYRRRLLKRVGKRAFRGTDVFFGRASLVSDTPILPREDAPWIAHLEDAAPKIRRELDALLQAREVLPRFQDIAVNQSRISPDDKWRMFALWGFGESSAFGCSLCPDTAACLAQIPGLESAFFSILAPGKHIPRHRGVTRALLRCHLGLLVPHSGTCSMDVAGQRVRWREGEAFVFDDTRPHEVWNYTEHERVVLLLDVRRPMRWPGRMLYTLLRAILRRTHFVREAVGNQLAWEQRVSGQLAQNASPRVK